VQLLTKSWLNKANVPTGMVFAVLSELPKGFSFKKKEDCQWLYNNQQFIHFEPMVKITEEYGGFSVREMVS
jgi:hypothetical protein